MEIQEERAAKKQVDQVRRNNASYATYLKRVGKAKEIIDRKPLINSWCMTDLQTINMLLKRKNDEGVAKNLLELKVQYDRWRMRPPLSKEYFLGNYVVDNINATNDSDGDDDNDVRDYEKVHTNTVQL